MFSIAYSRARTTLKDLLLQRRYIQTLRGVCLNKHIYIYIYIYIQIKNKSTVVPIRYNKIMLFLNNLLQFHNFGCVV